MGLFFWKKKAPSIGDADENPAAQEVETEEVAKPQIGEGKVSLEIAKLQGQIESLSEIRKTTSERFNVVNEQIGELRGTLNELTQQFSKVEVESTKAVDKVESVQPETFMTELRKTDGKTEALRANIESNEALMKDMMAELKNMRQKINFYKGTDQILKLNEEVKAELATIKKSEAITERHADRVETMFLDLGKKFSEFEKFDSIVKDLSRGFDKVQMDFDRIRVRVDTKADKKEVLNLMNKFNDFEKHTGNIIKLLDERSKHMKSDVKSIFAQVKDQLEKKFDVKLSVKDLPKESGKEKKTMNKFFKFFKRGNKEDSESEDKSEETEETSKEEDSKETQSSEAISAPKDELLSVSDDAQKPEDVSDKSKNKNKSDDKKQDVNEDDKKEEKKVDSEKKESKDKDDPPEEAPEVKEKKEKKKSSENEEETDDAEDKPSEN